jgi:DNA-binding NarL/FixJ family response regulator
MADPIRLLIVDDHPEVREALRTRLGRLPGVLVVGDGSGTEDDLRQVRTLRPDAVIIDSKRADGRGLEIIDGIVQSRLGTHVIVLTSYPGEWERWAVQRAGAERYLLKDIGSEELLDQIRAALAETAAPFSL